MQPENWTNGTNPNNIRSVELENIKIKFLDNIFMTGNLLIIWLCIFENSQEVHFSSIFIVFPQ